MKSNKSNHFSGVECKHEIYAAHQLACVKSEISTTPEPQTVLPKELSPPKIVVEKVEEDNVIQESVITRSNPITPVKCAPPSRTGPISVTAKLFAPYEPPKEVQPQPEIVRPHTATKTIFAPRTEDMSKGFLTFSEEEPGLTSEYIFV